MNGKSLNWTAVKLRYEIYKAYNLLNEEDRGRIDELESLPKKLKVGLISEYIKGKGINEKDIKIAEKGEIRVRITGDKRVKNRQWK